MKTSTQKIGDIGKSRRKRVEARTAALVAELSEGMEALAEARQGKRTLQTHAVESGARRKSEDIKVFISLRDSKCDECGEELGRKAWITLEENKGALCLACADLDELVFL